ncbi:MAG: GNAT family N-acetyltransferase [Mesorhizobium sp.]
MASRPDTIAIIAAEPSHAAAIDRLLRQLAASEGTLADLTYELPELTDALSRGQIHALVAMSGADLLGCLTYTWDFALWSGGRVMRIDDLIVDKDGRDQGIGTRLMTASAEQAVTMGATARWEVEAENAQAQQFYRRLGVDLKNKVVARWSIESMREVLGRNG